jgi:hypothetical protein
MAKFKVIVVGLEKAEDLVGSGKSNVEELLASFSKRRCKCSGLGDITDVLMTILDTYSESLAAELCLSGSSRQGVLSLQVRFEGVTADSSVVLVCLMIAENADDVFFCSRSMLNRGTITLVGDAVTHGVVCDLFKDGGNGAFGFTDNVVVCCST